MDHAVGAMMESVFWILDCRFWIDELRSFSFGVIQNPKSKIKNLKSGQASLEMTVALIGALLLLFGSLKVCLYFAERLIVRHQNYEGFFGANRVLAANDVRLPPLFLPPGPHPPEEPHNKLNIFEGDD